MIRSLLNYINDNLRFRDHLKRIEIYREFESSSYSAKKERQFESLANMLKYAQNNIIYYKEISCFDKFSQNEFSNIPLLTKQIIREKFSNLINPEVPAEKNTSGGSTGEPVVLLQCKNFRNWTSARIAYIGKKTGKEFHPKILRVWGSQREILEQSGNLRERARLIFKKIKLLNSFKMTQKDIRDFVQVINHFKPQIIHAYVQSIYEICKYINQHEKAIFIPKAIIVSAGTCYGFMENEIRKAFPCPLVNVYGSREVSGIAISCDGSDLLHVNMLTQYVEIVDDFGKPVPDGTPGNIVITSLTNKAMPLIRYEIGDRGIKSPLQKCPRCGWEGDIIEKVIGRSHDVLKNVNGDIIYGGFLTSLLYFREWLKKFQIVQEKETLLTFKVVLAEDVKSIPEFDKKEIVDSINKVFPNCDVDWQVVDDIVYDKSGKFRYIISKLNSENERKLMDDAHLSS